MATDRRPVMLLTACAGALVPWTVGLAVALPCRYTVGHWTITWTGFDVVLAGCFATTAWALRTDHRIALPASIATAVLLLCDAWFDLLSAQPGAGLLVSASTALFGEIPLAVVMAAIAARLMRSYVRLAPDDRTGSQSRSFGDGQLPSSYLNETFTRAR